MEKVDRRRSTFADLLFHFAAKVDLLRSKCFFCINNNRCLCVDVIRMHDNIMYLGIDVCVQPNSSEGERERGREKARESEKESHALRFVHMYSIVW